MKSMRCLAAAWLLGQALPAQDLLWQIPSPPSTTSYGTVSAFVDYDGDGARDLLHAAILNYGIPGQMVALEILSGMTGAVLQTVPQNTLRGAVYAGDVDGDGHPDVARLHTGSLTPNMYALEIYSLANQTQLWQNLGPLTYSYGWALLGDLDVNGDGRPDFLTITSHPSDSRVFVYDNSGTTRYLLQISGVHGVAVSLANMGDMNADGGDDFLVGVNDYTTQGKVLLVSGMTGAILRTSMGLLPGDKTCDFASNVGDIDGDGVTDYAACPWLSASRAIVVFWSGQTGQVIRTLPEFANSVVTGEDLDQDGVPDFVIGADWQVTTVPPHRYGSTRAYSGRDGTELWRVNNLPVFSGSAGSNAGFGWMEFAVSLGAQPGNPYPAIAWYDWNWALAGTYSGRVRGFRTNFAGQSPVSGTPCSTTAEAPILGVRQVQPSISSTYPQHTRITVAKGLPGAAAWLNLDYATATSFGGIPLPVALDPYGLPGCDLYVGPTASVFQVLGTSGIDRGYAQVELPRPLSPLTIGTSLVAQWLLFDPATLDYAATQKHQFRLQ
ncbi:MAG: VCBS repeat-containing protein [Planctomycetota bacterium]